MPLTLTSPAFTEGGAIPARFTGDGDDKSPPLQWSGAPDRTKAFALLADDPDCPDPAKPRRTWVHWVVADIPAATSSLPEGASGRAMPAGAVEGSNDSNDIGYSGPYPPIGKHRYFFKLYALDSPIGLPKGHTKADLLKAIGGHVLASTELMGTYARPKNR
jgi:Raf kinase inhibitor-like YbhB/YbcL family protein